MNQQVYARPIADALWQWRVAEGGLWQGEGCETGDAEALKAALPSDNTPVHIILPGEDVIAKEVPVDGIDKKLLAKMLPFELEDQIIEPVEDMHMSFGDIVDDRVQVFYVAKAVFEKILAPLSEAGCEVIECIPDYALLLQEDDTLSALFDGERVFVSVGREKSFTVDISLAPLTLQRLSFDLDVVTKLNLTAQDQDQLERLHGWIPDTWEEDLDIFMNEGEFWQAIAPREKVSKMNLRAGEFAKRLPFERWFHLWKIPVGGVAVAFVLSIIVMLGEYYSAKSKSLDVRKSIQEVYLNAVPNGRKGDEERQLESLLNKGKKQNNEPTNLMALLSGTAKTIKDMDSVKLANFRYNGDQRELQVNIEVNSLAELNRFKEKLDAVGLVADSPRSSAQGDIYQARMKISEK